MAKAIELTDSNFEEIINSGQTVLVDFWAAWCGPCKQIAPIVDELANELEGKAVIAKMDIDSNDNTPIKLGIRSIPTLMIFKDGQLVDKVVGLAPKAILSQKIAAQL
ncbi:MAG: thioredoxin [Spirosomataceae bacterium]